MTDYHSGQPSKRAYSTFRDQHGRKWGAVTENKTRHPSGPCSPQFKAPVYPPVTLIRPDPTDATQLVIDYEGWLSDLNSAHEAWDAALREAAVRLYPMDAVPTAIASPKPELLDQVGPRPRVVRREFVEAAAAGNKWALGMTDAVPSWAAKLIAEERVQVAREKSGAPVNKYPDVEEETTTYPQHQGYGRWKLSDGTSVQCKREEAEERELALHAETQEA